MPPGEIDAGLQQAAFLARLHHLEWVARACDAARELLTTDDGPRKEPTCPAP